MDLIQKDDLLVKQIKTGCLAHFAYVVVSNGEMLVIDPLRDIKEYEKIAEQLGAKVTYVALSHYHADFVSGYAALAANSGATVVYGPESHPENPKIHVAEDGEVLKIGNYSIKILHTPGHTFESSCFVLQDASSVPISVFTGDTLFLGDVGRPDLAQKGEITEVDLAKMLFSSLKKLKALPDNVIVLPGHGAGSACGKNISDGGSCDIGTQKANNYALLIQDENEFVKAVTTGLEQPPAYFGHNVGMNKAVGIALADDVVTQSLHQLSVEEVKFLLSQKDTYVLDVRDPKLFDISHIPGALHVPFSGPFAIWAAFILDSKDRIILVAEQGIFFLK